MKLLVIGAMLCATASLGLAQKERPAPLSSEEIKLLAESEVRDGGTVKLRGHVQVITPSTTIYADEAEYNPLTGELNARGHVHMRLLRAKPRVEIQNSTPEDIPLSSPK